MIESWILAFCILGVNFLLAGMIMHSSLKNREEFLRRRKESWGQASNVVYSKDQIENLSVYGKYKSVKESFYIDEITWKDLDMDRVFLRMNQTVSAPGEEYFLYLLRTPKLREEDLQKREKLMRFFAQDEEKRLALQLILAQIPKSGAASIGKKLQALNEAKPIRETKHWALCAAAVFALIFMLFQPVYGFFLFLAVACVNIADYYGAGDRKQVEVHLSCFQSVKRMLGAAKRIKRLEWEEIEECCAPMGQAQENLRAFQKGSYWVSGKDSVSGGVEAVLADLIRMIFHVDLIRYNKMLGEIHGHRDDAECLLDNLGELDCAMAAASFREALPVWCRPSFQNEMRMQVSGLYHPLVKEPVSNSFSLQRGMLLTGSNASGKSTFLRNVAINGILAQTIATCTALSYQAPMSRILTSMALSDNLERGESYFMVEIRSLKRILDAADQEGPLLCMVDEVLRGTNTIERIAASSRILTSLRKEKVFCFAATHDIELTYILEDCYENYHFGEEVRERDVRFSYRLKEGRASSRNAIRLLEMLGYQEAVVESARMAAREFEKTGVWSRV
ncbi:MAG: DNA mismatch repair protein MutS [Lachnospiraceae bacterium]|nr:DNA mismatch repair protein MutS [Lachnospiraceae bacterium]